MNANDVRAVALMLERDYGMTQTAERLREACREESRPPDGSDRLAVRAWARERASTARTLTAQAERALVAAGDKQTVTGVATAAVSSLTDLLSATYDGQNGEAFACRRP